MIQTFSNKRVTATLDVEEGDLCVVREIYVEDVYHFTPGPGWHVLDIGAHRGIFSTYAALLGAQVTSYEPNPPSFAALERNIALNKCEGRITAHNAGVWTKSDTIRLNQNVVCTGGTSIFTKGLKNIDGTYATAKEAGETNSLLVPVVPFAEVLGDQPWDLVKLDAEGIEFELLGKATQAQLRRIKFLTVEVHNDIGTDWQYQQMIRNVAQAFNLTGVSEVSGKLNYIYATRR